MTVELSNVPDKINDAISSVLTKQTPQIEIKPRGKPRTRAVKGAKPKVKGRGKKVVEEVVESIQKIDSGISKSLAQTASAVASSFSSSSSKSSMGSIQRGSKTSIEINTTKLWAIACFAVSVVFAFYALQSLYSASSYRSSNPNAGKLLSPTPEEYDELKAGPFFALFWAKSCPHCKTILKTLQTACKDIKHTPCIALESGAFKEEFIKRKVEYIPYFIYENNGKTIEYDEDKANGIKGDRSPEDIKKWMKVHDKNSS